MKKLLTVKTKWEYYVANYAGIVILLGLTIWSLTAAIGDKGLRFSSFFFWVAILLFVIILFALISILSSMKEITVTDKGLTISYNFKNHKSIVNFAEVAKFISVEKKKSSSALFDSFSLNMKDGRVFEFSRAQFNNYEKLKSISRKAIH